MMFGNLHTQELIQFIKNLHQKLPEINQNSVMNRKKKIDCKSCFIDEVGFRTVSNSNGNTNLRTNIEVKLKYCLTFC